MGFFIDLGRWGAGGLVVENDGFSCVFMLIWGVGELGGWGLESIAFQWFFH